MTITRENKNGIGILTIGNDELTLTIAPAMGGKIISLFNKALGKEFCWTNKDLPLAIQSPGADYDANFFGGIDELMPNDIPESIDSISYPDHGELWTAALDYELYEDGLRVQGQLPLSGLHYSKTIRMVDGIASVHLDYTITNTTGSRRHFLWKLHAALRIAPGDKLLTTARKARVVDPAYSRFTSLTPFAWPLIEGKDASLIPEKNNSMDFFYLYDIPRAEMQLSYADGISLFSYSYDGKIFPFQWYFASYGAFLDHYTVILEPCTSMPISVNEAQAAGQCTLLEPGESIHTTVTIFAGEKKHYLSTHG